MNSLELISQQRQKESKLLKIFLVSSLMGSLVLHASSMAMRVGNFWTDLPNDLPIVVEESEMEVTVIENSPEQPIKEATLPTEEPPSNLDIPPEVAFVPDLAPPPIALAPETPLPTEELPSKPDIPQEVASVPDLAPPPITPETQAPLPTGVDAPSNAPPLPNPDPVTPMTNAAGNTPVPGANGPIANPQGTGSGFGNRTQPTGFAAGGRQNGNPQGNPGGTLGGNPSRTQTAVRTGGTPSSNGTQTAVRTVPSTPQPARSQPPQPVCVSCPEPRFQGVEASPRVELRILADGSVEVQLRQSSGNPEVDRATMETMRQWRFDPQTVPQEGVSRRVRVTYEEEGSNFQVENENRRRLEAERQAAEQRRREEALIQQPPNPATETPDQPAAIGSPPSTPASSTPTPEAPVPLPSPAPVEVPPPPSETTPVEAPPPPPETAPVEVPPPPPETTPVEVLPPPPETTPVEAPPPPPEAPVSSPSNS